MESAALEQKEQKWEWVGCGNECDPDDGEICMCCRCLAACGLGVIIVPSFGTLQAISGGLMIKSLVVNAATNVKVFAGFVVVFDLFAVSFAFIFACILFSACVDE